MNTRTRKMSVGFIAVVALVLGAVLPASAAVVETDAYVNEVLPSAGYTG